MKRARFRGNSSRRSGLLSQAAHLLLGLVFLPPALAVWIRLFRLAPTLPFQKTILLPILIGAGTYGIIHFLFRRPMTVYVFGHELTHAAAALLCGYQVKSLFVSEKGGEVELSNTNTFVALAPYCVPLYTLAVVLAYGLVRHYTALTSPPAWVGVGLGASLSFHGALTFHALRQDQPDLRHAGFFFSLVMILLCNGLVLALLTKLMFPSSLNLQTFGYGWFAESRSLFFKIWEGARAAVLWVGMHTPKPGGTTL